MNHAVANLDAAPLPARCGEAELVDRCATVALETHGAALDRREANLFRLAAMLLGRRHQTEAKQLLRVSNDYFELHPDERLPAGEAVRQGWVTSPARFQTLLSARLAK